MVSFNKLLALVCTLVLSVSSLQGAELIMNGDFETGDFTGWTVEHQAGTSGEWLVYSGKTLPISGSDFFHPSGDLHGAAFDHTGPSCSVIYQDIVMPRDLATLTFTYYYQDHDTIHTLDYDHQASQQQFRVDILHPDSYPFSVNANDVLLNVFQLPSDSPQNCEPTTITQDLKAFSGQTIRLRFAAVNHAGHFKVGIDDVSIQTNKKLKAKKIR